ncbi:MAG: HD domain-containing protein [Candidatus Saccharibacteria bacterium]|nr:HD domain-containing protein [Candidatus Saccharibacteria bacterium]
MSEIFQTFNPNSEISLKKFKEILKNSERFTEADLALINQALEFGKKYHQGQKRLSGKDYFKCHCLHVGLYLHVLQLDAAIIVAGILHDSLEDTEATLKIIEDQFGSEIAFLIDGVSNLSDIKYRYYKQKISSLRKFFVAVSKDVRVIIIKLCDRLHNLQTLEYLEADKQKRIAEESMLIHAQLAERLNISQLHKQINDLAFPYVFKKDCQRVKALQKQTLKNVDKVIEKVYRKCLIILDKNLDYKPSIDRRLKSTYSLYKKLLKEDWNIKAIYDVIALRIILKDPADCYKVLGLIHNQWQPINQRFKDYIASPKSNGYASLHTTIFTGDGSVAEIQIKTAEMHQLAEYGLARHLQYKKDTSRDPLEMRKKTTFDWLDQLKLMHAQEKFDVKDYINDLRSDFFNDRIFVKTPKGDVIDLIQGATILDFAFAIHTDIGLIAKGGYINGSYKALKTPLNNLDIVEIVTDKKIKPQNKWLTWVKTPLAIRSLKSCLGKNQKPNPTKSR